MNERTKQLFQEAYSHFGHGKYFTQELLAEKFAELMVQKFDNILLLQYVDCIGNHDKKSAELIGQIRAKTKTYFGVEE